MPTPQPFQETFENVTAIVKGNVYFEGKVVSHALTFADGSTKTLGMIFPGSFTFNTEAPESMVITDGACRAKVAGTTDWSGYAAGASFEVPADSSFEIAVDAGVCQYICSFH